MAQLICGRLKNTPGIWRVDGIGHIQASKSLGTRINYLFSEIDPKFLSDPHSISASTGQVFQLKGHSSWLRHFTPGSIWQEGQKTIVPQTISFPIDVTIDGDHCIYTQANTVPYSFAPLETLLPASHLNFGENSDHLNQTLFALIKKPVMKGPKANYLIIPTSELFRFYAGASSRLLSSALTGRSKELVESAELVDGEAIIYDSTGTLTKREALFYGRALVSPEAREAFFGPYKHLVAAGLLNEAPPPLYINSRFPFTGKTTLYVTGKKIKLKNKETLAEEWAIIVTQIRNCSHPLGFEKLTLVRNGTSVIGDGNTSGYRRPPRSIKTDPEVPLETNDSASDQSTGTLITTNQVTSLINQINNIHFKKRVIEIDEFERCAREANEESTGNTFENGKNEADGSGNQKTEEVDVTVQDLEKTFLLFIEMLKYLRIKSKQYDWEIKTLPYKKNETIDGETVTTFPNPGNRFTWYKIFLEDNDLKGRSRRIFWAQIKIQNRYIYLIEMELRAKEKNRNLLTITPKLTGGIPCEFSVKSFENLLILTAVNNGWPLDDRKWKTKHAEIAKELAAQFNFQSLPYVQISTNNDIAATSVVGKLSVNENASEPTQLSAEQWAQDIFEKITGVATQ